MNRLTLNFISMFMLVTLALIPNASAKTKVVVEQKVVVPEPVENSKAFSEASTKNKAKNSFKQFYMKPKAKPREGEAPGMGKTVKPRVAVSRFGDIKSLGNNPFSAFIGETRVDDTTGDVIKTNWDKEAYEGFTEDVISALMELDQFKVIERDEVNKILREQGFQNSAFTEKVTDKDFGQITGVDYIVTGTAGDDETGDVVVNLRIYDVYRGEILSAKRVKSKNTYEAIQQAVSFISEKIEPEQYTLKVSRVDKDTLFLNGGENVGLVSGEKFLVFSVKNKIVDPDTNEVLGIEKERVAMVTIGSVEAKFSTATVLEQTKPIKTGDILKPYSGIYFSGKAARE